MSSILARLIFGTSLLIASPVPAQGTNWVKVADGVWLDNSRTYRSPSRVTVNYFAYSGTSTDPVLMTMGGGLFTLDCNSRQVMNEIGEVWHMASDDPIYRLLCN